MIRLLASGMAVLSFAIGAYFAAITIWLISVAVTSGGPFLVLAGLPILFGGLLAIFFLVVGNACRMTARVDGQVKTEPGDIFK
jgi:hypothetical protein